MSTARRIAANSVYQLVGKFVTLALSLVMVAFLARRLGVAAYGDYTIALTFSQMFAIFADFGVAVYLLKRLSGASRLAEEEGRLLGTVTLLRIVTAVIGSIGAFGLAYLLPYESSLHHAIAVALVAVVIQMVNGLYVVVLQSQLEMKYAAISEAAGRLAMLTGAYLVLYADMGVVAVLGAQVVGNLVNLIITYLASRRFVVPIFKGGSTQDWLPIMRASAFIGISSVFSYVYFKTDLLFLSFLDIPGRENQVEVGLYGTAYKVLEIYILIPGVLLGSVFPLLAAAIAQRHRERTALLFNRAFDLMLGLGLAIGLGTSLFAAAVVQAIAGPEFAPAASALAVLALAIPLNFIGSVFNYSLLALNKQRALTVLYGGIALANVAANVVLIPRYSFMAASWVTVITEVAVVAGGYLLMRKDIALKMRPMGSGFIVVLALSAAAIAWSLRDYGLWLQLLAYCSILALGGVTVVRGLLSKEL